MVQSAAPTVAQYLASLPAERRTVVAKVRATVKRAIPKGYKESMGYGMIMWSVPLSVLPDTYNGHPLCYVALAAQQRHFALYLMGPYGEPALLAELKAGYKAAGLKLDMGKSCLRFQSLDDIALDVVGRVISRVPMTTYVAMYQKTRRTK
ncbi:MAG: DUF1801 domain-containing protein [Gemmatimonadaceae bacterium]|nr:DUF1801 domain-containing protein [Gemmatimonadaceae bacterium]